MRVTTDPDAPARRSYSYLGPAGTFTEAALAQVPEARNQHWRSVRNVGEALADVVEGRSDAAMIAIENSVDGGVSTAQDALATMPGLRIVGEYLVPVDFVLVARPGTTLEQVSLIAAHPVAYAQCLQWLTRTLPAHAHVPASSNVASAMGLLDGTSDADAAIAPPGILEHHELTLLAENLGDNPNAVTRFVLVARTVAPPAPTGADKTSLIAELPDDHPGALLEMLEQFATRGINLSLLASRPIGDASAATGSSSTPMATSRTSAWPTRCWVCAASARKSSSSGPTPARTARSCAIPSGTPTTSSSRRATGCAGC